MRYAFNLPNYGEFCDVRALAEIAAAAEAGGWDGFFIWDHMSPVFYPGMLEPTADTTVALTAIALATERLRFGPMVTPLARRRVQKVAREFATLDHLSNGRAVLGVGIGVPPETEYEAFGEDTMEALAELGLALREELYAGETDALQVMHDYCADDEVSGGNSEVGHQLASILEAY